MIETQMGGGRMSREIWRVCEISGAGRLFPGNDQEERSEKCADPHAGMWITSLYIAVMICASLVNRQTDTQTAFSGLYY